MTDDVAAAAVHVEPWRHWSATEARRRITRIVPEGVGLCLDDIDHPQYQELSTGRRYDPPPLDPDAHDWLVENAPMLLERMNRRRQPRSGPKPRTAPPPPWTNSGQMFEFGTTRGYSNITYMACFFGVSSMMRVSDSIQFCIWPGLQGNAPNTVLQPVMEHNLTGFNQPLNSWTLQDVCNVGLTPFGDTAVVVTQPLGVWGVIQWKGAEQLWLIKFYRGNAGNKGPGLARPAYTSGLSVPVGFQGFSRQQLKMTVPLVGIEIPGGNSANGSGPWDCTNICTTSVFGGLTVKQETELVPIQWVPENLWFGSVCSCGYSAPIASPTANGQTQCNLTINSF